MFNSKKDKHNDKITPDFVPMIRIVFWNSMGFFFFWFLIPYVSKQLIGVSAPELGEERSLKLFLVNRKFDPSGL